MTRTHTIYWDEDSIAPLRAEITKLREDLDRRKRYIDSRAFEAMETRLLLLEKTTILLTDWAD